MFFFRSRTLYEIIRNNHAKHAKSFEKRSFDMKVNVRWASSSVCFA